MVRTKLRNRPFPDYTRGEEIFNMVSHAVGAAFGVVILVLTVVFSAKSGSPWAVTGCAIYGASLVLLYSVSAIYHGLHKNMGKQVMRVLDHCTIYFLIGGTYTPILLTVIRETSPLAAWLLFGAVCGLAALASVFTAIDLKKYSKLSMACYIGMGWSILLCFPVAIAAIPKTGLILLLLGGVAYTVGAVIYGIGKRYRYMHSVFHLFVILGSILQFLSIFFYVI